LTGYTRQPLRRLNDYTVRVFEWAGNGLLDLVIKKHHSVFQAHDSKRLFNDNSVVWPLRVLFQSIAVYITGGRNSAKNEQKNVQIPLPYVTSYLTVLTRERANKISWRVGKRLRKDIQGPDQARKPGVSAAS